MSRPTPYVQCIAVSLCFALIVGVIGLYHGLAMAQKAEVPATADWVEEIEKIFIRSGRLQTMPRQAL